MQGHKYSRICNLFSKFLIAGMICTTTDTISIPVGEMHLHARMFFALAHTSSIPMGAINFCMKERFLHADSTSIDHLSANGKDVFWAFMDLERPMILSIDMVSGRCLECMELEENC